MNYHNLNDVELMTRVVQADDAALEALYERYASAIMGLAVRILRDQATAEEVVQETFWRVWRRADSFQAHRGAFKSWLFSIAHRLAIDTLRRRKVRPQPAQNEMETERIDTASDPDMNVAERVDVELNRQQVRVALDILPADQYQVIELAYFQGLTRQEIAQEIGKPLGTVHTRARLALQKLHKALQAEGFEA